MNQSSTTREFGRSLVIDVLIPIVVILAVYLALYAIALEGKVYRLTGVDPVTRINTHAIEPNFHFCNTALCRVFKPALWLDRRLRSEYWITIENKISGTKWKNP